MYFTDASFAIVSWQLAPPINNSTLLLCAVPILALIDLASPSVCICRLSCGAMGQSHLVDHRACGSESRAAPVPRSEGLLSRALHDLRR